MNRLTLGELSANGVVSFGDGYRTKRAEHGQPGYRIIRVADVGDGTVSLDGPDFVSINMREQIGPKSAMAGDILLTTKGTVGRVAVMPQVAERAVYSPQLCYFRVGDQSVLDARYLRYWLRSTDFRNQAADRMNNTDMAAYINLADVRSLELTLPGIKEQRAIAEVLGALDDKIAANAELVSAADHLAATIFSSLIEDSRNVPLTELADFINGRAYTKDATGTGRVVIRIAELNSGVGGSTVYNDIDVPKQNVARPGDLLFAWSGSLTLRRWFLPEGIINQHIFKVLPKDGYPMWCVNGALHRKLAQFKRVAAGKATTMGHIQRRHLDEPVAVPSSERIADYDTVMSGLWERALAAERESIALGHTRDGLLPLLMSGKVRVKDAEKMVEEVV